MMFVFKYLENFLLVELTNSFYSAGILMLLKLPLQSHLYARHTYGILYPQEKSLLEAVIRRCSIEKVF